MQPRRPADRDAGQRLKALLRCAAIALVATVLAAATGCTATGAVITLAAASTDSSVTWSVVKHLHQQITEGDPPACVKLNSVQRALATRCGSFVTGSIVAADIARTGLAECALTLAARDPQLWPVVPELLDKGARAEACAVTPLVELAQRHPCPDFGSASARSVQALARLADADPRAIHHDVMRMLSCPAARAAGLDTVLAGWRSRGALQPGKLGFGPLGALDPDYLDSPFARALEHDGHTARAALGGYDGRLPPGFEEALRTSHWAALDWWLQRAPELAARVPPSQGNQLSWLPLARVLVPSFLAHPETRPEMVEYLMARGADPRQRIPSNENQSVVAFARLIKSPLLPLLEQQAARAAPAQPPTSTGAEQLAAALDGSERAGRLQR